MADFTSEIKTIPYADSLVYDILSDFSNLELVKDKIPINNGRELVFDKDSCSLSIDPIGKVKFTIVEREPTSTIKFQTEQLPFDVKLWNQLIASEGSETKMKLTIRAELNAFIKPMVSKPLQEALTKMADMLANLPYDEIQNKKKIG